jgi:FixJ family two-component response regulator
VPIRLPSSSVLFTGDVRKLSPHSFPSGPFVDAYTSPLSALSNFKPNEFGLLLLDIRMPAMDSFELFKKMKSKDSKVEVCFITAFEDYREECKESSHVR